MHSVVNCSMNRVEDCTPLIFSVSTRSSLLQVKLQVADGCCSLSRADDWKFQSSGESGCEFYRLSLLLQLLQPLLLLSDVLWLA